MNVVRGKNLWRSSGEGGAGVETREEGGCVTAPRQVRLAGAVGRESVPQASISLALSFVKL